MPVERKLFVDTSNVAKPLLCIECYVEVWPYFSPNMNRSRGRGFVVSLNGDRSLTFCDVKYNETSGSGTHKIPPSKKSL